MRMPKRIKFRKQQRGTMRGNATRGNYVAFGDYGLQALEAHWVSARQIEAGRIAAQHFLRRQGKVYIRIFPDKPVSKKPLETRMGKGKADTDFWAATVGHGQARDHALRDRRGAGDPGQGGTRPHRAQDAGAMPVRGETVGCLRSRI
jgi:large subunit ribosomal protein L16